MRMNSSLPQVEVGYSGHIDASAIFSLAGNLGEVAKSSSRTRLALPFERRRQLCPPVQSGGKQAS
jgi:hypothetical protein